MKKDDYINYVESIQPEQGLKNRLKNKVLKHNKTKRNYIYFGVAAAACVLAMALILSQILNAPVQENLPPVAINSPVQTQIKSPIPTQELPEAYTQQLCSIAYQVDDWVYFAYYDYDDDTQNGIYKLNKNGNTPIKLCDAIAENLIVDGDYIYFIEMLSTNQDGESDYRVMRIKTDGSSKTEIFKNPNEGYITGLQISDGYLFVTDDAAIYKIAMDGSGYEEFIDYTADEFIKHLLPPGIVDKINKDDVESGKFIYGMRLLQFLNVKDGWMYYTDEPWDSPGYKLVKKKIDGTERTVLYENGVNEKVIRGDWIYFLGQDFTDDADDDDTENTGEAYTYIAKIKMDGTGFKELKRHVDIFGKEGFETFDKIFADDDWVYFNFKRKSEWQEWDTREICRIRTDGTDYQVLASECIMTSVTDDYIYYKNYWDNNSAGFVSKLMKMKKDGSEKQKIEFFATEAEETYEINENSLSVIVKDAYEKDGKKYVVLDQVAEYEVDGIYGFTNDNKAVREFEVSDDATFAMLKDGKNKDSLVEVGWEFFKENSKKQLVNKSKKVPGYYKIELDQNGIIREIQFFYWYSGSVKLPYEISETEDLLPQPVEPTPSVELE